MGFLLFAGMVGTILASSYTVKKEIESTSIDKKTQAHYNNWYNEQDKIKYHFTSILKRCNVKYNKKTNRPIAYEPLPCIAYLRKQGYKEKEINYFKQLYDERYEEEKNEYFNNIDNKHKDLLKTTNTQKKTYYTFNITNYNEKTKHSFKKRANILLQDELWKTLVDNYSYYHDGNNLVEVWNLYLPPNIKRKEIKNIYMEVCKKQNIHNSII